jgi:glycosyltransferase involved in cell wall biosynthesis
MTRAVRPVRVAFLQAWLTFGGAERLVQSLVMRMDRTRVDPVIVNLYEPGAVGEELIAAGHRSVDRLARSRFDLRTGARLREVLARERVDVTYVYDSALPMFWAGLERRRSAQPPLVLGFHSTGKLGDPVQHFVANRTTLPVADRFVALADSHRAWLCEHLRVAAARFDVIVSGVDLEVFAPAPDRAAVRRELGLPESAPLAALVAALRPEKHVPLFVEAAARVHAVQPDARFLVVGDGPERGAIEGAVAAHGLGGVVTLLGARRDIPRIWRAVDVAVLSSHPVVETLPVTLLEAHACGVPAVSTDVGSVRDVIVEGETGHLVPPGDAAALAGRLGGLLADPVMRARMGAAARRRAEQHFDRTTMVRAYEDLFVRVARVAR